MSSNARRIQRFTAVASRVWHSESGEHCPSVFIVIGSAKRLNRPPPQSVNCRTSVTAAAAELSRVRALRSNEPWLRTGYHYMSGALALMLAASAALVRLQRHTRSNMNNVSISGWIDRVIVNAKWQTQAAKWAESLLNDAGRCMTYYILRVMLDRMRATADEMRREEMRRGGWSITVHHIVRLFTNANNSRVI